MKPINKLLATSLIVGSSLSNIHAQDIQKVFGDDQSPKTEQLDNRLETVASTPTRTTYTFNNTY